MSDIYCAACKRRAPGDGAEVVKASNISGRGWRCAGCSERERAAISAVNARRAAGVGRG